MSNSFLVCVLTSCFLLSLAHDQLQPQCDLTTCPITPKLQLTLKPGLSQALCLELPNYHPAGEDFVTLFNASAGVCSSYQDHRTNQTKTCKIVILDKNRTNCTHIAIILECRLSAWVSQVVPVEEVTTQPPRHDDSRSKRSLHDYQDHEELGLSIQLNSTNHPLTGYAACNVYMNVTWVDIGCNIEQRHGSAIDSCSGVGKVISQVGTTNSWFVAESKGISEVGDRAILTDKYATFCGQLSFDTSSSGIALPCEVHYESGEDIRALVGTDLVLNGSTEYLAFRCTGQWDKVDVGEAQIIFERNLTKSSDLSDECHILSASRPFYSQYASIPVHWAHGEANLCDKVTTLNFDTCTKMCTDNAQLNEGLCDILAGIILDNEQLSDGDLGALLDILNALTNVSGVDTLEVTVDIIDSLTNSLQDNSTALSLERGEMLASVIDHLLNEDKEDDWRVLQQRQGKNNFQFSSAMLLASLEQFLDTAGMGLGDEALHYTGSNIRSLTVESVMVQDVETGPHEILISQGDGLPSLVEIPTQVLCADKSSYEGSDGCLSVVATALVDALPLYLDQSLNSQTSFVNTPLLLLSIPMPLNSDALLKENPVRLHFNPLQSNKYARPSCVFWSFTESTWSTAGINTEETANGTYICTTTHLTSFAVLVGLTSNNNINNETTTEVFALNIVSYVGCSVSLICLMLTLLVFITCGKHLKKGVLLYVHINFCLSLSLGLFVFVGGIETAISIHILCATIAAILHYLFLSAFCWMLAEGIMLYLLVVKVFGKMASRWYYSLLLGWGVPFPIVAISVGIRHDMYGTDNFCWLSTEKGTIWAFVGPILVIICINTVFLVLTVCSLLRSRKYGGAERGVGVIQLVKSGIKSTIILLPLLGLTWVLGIFAVNQNTTVFAWLFTIFNSLQGCLFFFLHVLRNKKVYTSVKNAVCCMSTTRVRSGSTKKDTSTNVTVTTSASSYATNIIAFNGPRSLNGIGRSFSQTSEESSSSSSSV